MDLDVPAPVELADRLRKKGYKLQKNVVTADDLAVELKKFF